MNDSPSPEQLAARKKTLQAAAGILKENNANDWDHLFTCICPAFDPQCTMAMSTVVQELIVIAYNTNLDYDLAELRKGYSNE